MGNPLGVQFTPDLKVLRDPKSPVHPSGKTRLKCSIPREHGVIHALDWVLKSLRPVQP